MEEEPEDIPKDDLVFNERVLYQELIDDKEKGKHQKGMRGVLSLKNSLKWPDIYEKEVCQKIFYIGKNHLASQQKEEIKLNEGENLRQKSNQESLKKKKKPMSKNQLKQLLKIQESIEAQKLTLETVLKISSLWQQYCLQIVGKDRDQTGICAKILKADWTGAFIQISNSTNKTMIGVQGYVTKETQRTFQIMNEKGEKKTILKQGTVVEITVYLNKKEKTGKGEKMEIEEEEEKRVKVRVWLDNMMQRSHMRTKQKFKEKEGKLDLF